MAVLQSTLANQYRHVIGDMVIRFFTLAGNNGDTFVYPGAGDILEVNVAPTTAVAVGVTWSGNTITFVTSGAWAASVSVIARVG
jgi:hypothetical protein